MSKYLDLIGLTTFKSKLDITYAKKDNVYDKTATDELLSVKANSSDVYTKTATDSLLSTKANSANVYTKAEVDSAIQAAITGAINGAY